MTARFFGWNESSRRCWINLNCVSLARWYADKKRLEVFIAGSDGKSDRVELTGEAAQKLMEALDALP